MAKKYDPLQSTPSGLFTEIQIVFWAVGGAWVLALTLAEVRTRRDASSWLLGLWMFGTFLFAALFNWIANGRSLLPMAPAFGILLVRYLEQNVLAGRKTWPRGVTICLAAGGVLALLAARADFRLATPSTRSARQSLGRIRPRDEAAVVRGTLRVFNATYSLGASALDLKRSVVDPGDHLAIPRNNSNLLLPSPRKVTMRETLTFPGPGLLATWNETMGAGFYASVWGPLPFVLAVCRRKACRCMFLGRCLPLPLKAKNRGASGRASFKRATAKMPGFRGTVGGRTTLHCNWSKIQL